MKIKKMYITKGYLKKKFIKNCNIKILRPTTGLIKNYLFYWLEILLINFNEINILDCYAGTGILSFETISRFSTINKVTLIDNNKLIIQYLYKNKILLGINKIKIIYKNSLLFFNKYNRSFKYNLIFIDPPYNQNINIILKLLIKNNWLNHQSIIYLEYSKKNNIFTIPSYWKLYKQKITSISIHQIYIINK